MFLEAEYSDNDVAVVSVEVSPRRDDGKLHR